MQLILIILTQILLSKSRIYIYTYTHTYTHKLIFLILVAERCSQQHETTLTLIMNLETLATPDRYVYVGLARSRRLFFPANLHRDLESATRDTPLAEQDGGTSWEDEEHEEEEDAGRKRRSGWSHMTMYDEGMMDEGAASLRDRDMIAGRRGGPSVRFFSLSFTLEWLVQCVSPFPRSARNTRELEPPLSPVWPILLSYSMDTGEAALLRRIYTFSFWIFILNNLFTHLYKEDENWNIFIDKCLFNDWIRKY